MKTVGFGSAAWTGAAGAEVCGQIAHGTEERQYGKQRMVLESLGYVGIAADDVAGWAAFGSDLLGFQKIDGTSSSLTFRMDDRKQRLFVDGAADAPAYTFGWELADDRALCALTSRLEGAGIRYRREPAALAERRGVSDIISFADPMDNRLEAFYGALEDDRPFVPGRTVSGFRTGPLGMGHVVLTVRDLHGARAFYEEVLSFRLTDYITEPFTAYFYHLNARHHSLALIPHDRDGVHHLMAEYGMLDDVGQAYDIALAEELVGVSLGRHANDFMVSFYANTPSGCLFECGWGGLSIDVESWEPSECVSGPSLWGHERSWLPEARRAAARDLRMEAARRGVRAPVQVIAGNYRVMTE